MSCLSNYRDLKRKPKVPKNAKIRTTFLKTQQQKFEFISVDSQGKQQ